MTWHFEIKSTCPLFSTAVTIAPPHSEHTFVTDRRYDKLGNGIIKTHHVSALIEGSSTTTVPGWGSYTSVGFIHDSPQWPGKQTGPFSETAHAKAGPDGAVYACFAAAPNVKLDYEVFEGPHEYRVECCDVYAVIARGTARVGDIGERWQIHHFSPRSVSYVTTASSDSVVFYIWNQMTMPAQ